MDAVFNKLAIYMGGQITGDQLKLVFCIIATYPSALLYRCLPANNPTIKHLFSIGFTLLTLLVVLRSYDGFIHITTTCLVTYFFCKSYSAKNMPWINFAWVMTSMAVCHLDRQFFKGFEGDTQLDYSGAMMIITIKLTSFGFNVADGRNGAVTDHDKRMQIKQYPTLIEFFGWTYFFSGFMTGPTCEYMDYIRFTHHFFLSADSKVSPARPTLQVLAKVAAVMLFLVLVAPNYASALALEPSFVTWPFYKRLVFIMIGAVGTRCKYYCIWLLYEGSCVLCGFGYNGYDPRTGQHKWDRLSNVDMFQVELSQSYKQLTSVWNTGANNWLRHYVYLRSVPQNTKPTAATTIVTYLTSSIWHGFHPGYYFLFVSVALLQVLGRRIRRAVRPFMLTPDGQTPLPRKKVYDFLGWFFTMGTVAFLVTPFDLLYISRTFYVWHQVYYVHYVVLLLGWCLLLATEKQLLALQKRYCIKPPAAVEKQNAHVSTPGLENKPPVMMMN